MLSYAREGIGKCRMSRTALSVSLVNMWLWLFMPVMHGSLSISQILLHPQVRIPFVGLWHFSCDLFYCPESSGHGCPPPRPLAISFDNPSLCLCNEKQHSSRGMTCSVSAGAGTEDATLAADWIAPSGCCEPDPPVVTPTLLLICAPNTLREPGKEDFMDPCFHHSWHLKAQPTLSAPSWLTSHNGTRLTITYFCKYTSLFIMTPLLFIQLRPSYVIVDSGLQEVQEQRSHVFSTIQNANGSLRKDT